VFGIVSDLELLYGVGEPGNSKHALFRYMLALRAL
jgi:hypothetical protein